MAENIFHPILNVAKKLDKMYKEAEPEPFFREKGTVKRAVDSYVKNYINHSKNNEMNLLARIRAEIQFLTELHPLISPQITKDLNATAIMELVKKAKEGKDPVKDQYIRLLARRIFLETVNEADYLEDVKTDPVWVHDVAKKFFLSHEDVNDSMKQFVLRRPPKINI